MQRHDFDVQQGVGSGSGARLALMPERDDPELGAARGATAPPSTMTKTRGGDVEETLAVYLQQCSVELTCDDLALLAAAFLALLSLAFTRDLPHEVPKKEQDPETEAGRHA